MITLGVWLNEKAGAIKREILRQFGAITAIPYCAVYSRAGTFAPPTDFKTSAFPGLIAWHVVEQSCGHKIISYWQDEEHYKYARVRLEDALKLGGSLDWRGAAGDLYAKEWAWWPSSIKEAVIAIAAVIGAVNVISTALEKVSESLWGTPQLAVSFASPKFNITEGQSSQIAITATNSGFVPVELNAYANLIGSSGSPLS